MPITLHILPDNHRAVIHAILANRRPSLHRLRWKAASVLLAMVAGLVALAVAVEDPLPLLAALPLLLVGLALLLQQPRVLAAVRRELARAPEDPQTVTITEANVTTTSPLASSTFEWAYVTSMMETDEVYALRRARMIVSVLPKSAFTPEQADGFRALLAGRGLIRA